MIRGIFRSLVLVPAVGVGLSLGAATVQAAYPEQPITIVVPFSAGGGADLVARLLAQNLPAHLNDASIVVDNKPGASGNIGAAFVARSKADGYTLLVTNTTLTINASLDMTQGFDVNKDLQPVANLVSTPIALAVNSKVPAKTVAELLSYAQKNNGQLSYSSCGNGTPQHFAGEKFNLLGELDIVHVPYKGCAPAINDGVGNQVPILFSTIPNVAPHAESGSLRMLAVASKERLSFMPDIPAIAETKPFGDMDITVRFGLFAPAGLPADRLKQIETAVLDTMKDEKLQKEFRDRYYEIDVRNSADFTKLVRDEVASYKKLAEQSNISLK